MIYTGPREANLMRLTRGISYKPLAFVGEIVQVYTYRGDVARDPSLAIRFL